jgi:tRNA pseudouridine55 synthase
MSEKSEKRVKHNISGWVVLDKPVGLSSTQAMAKVRGSLSAAKSGHGGTLDPFATGVLPIALGEATKLMQYVLDGDKTYRFTVRWGEARDTDDLTGKVTATSDTRPNENQIREAIKKYFGEIQQLPPNFSALHIDGERAYDLARRGEEVVLQPRAIHIYRYDYLGSPSADEAVFEVDCGKGTYIRSLARDLGRDLGCLGHVTVLIRLKSGPFSLENAVSLEKCMEKSEEFRHNKPTPDSLRELVLPLTAALDDIPGIAVNEQEARKLRQGQTIPLHPMRVSDEARGAALVAARDALGLVAITQIKWDALQPLRVFNVNNEGVPDVAAR